MSRRKVLITQCSLSISEDDKKGLFDNAKREDKALVDAMITYAEDHFGDIEIFDRFNNIFVTSNGYYVALYEDDIKLTEQ